MNRSSRILVAGHTGMIGSAFARYFKNNSFENVKYISSNQLNLLNKEEVFKYFKSFQPEYIFLTAGKVAGILENNLFPADFIHNNLVIQSNVFDSAIKNNVKKLVFFCSSCMYPKNSKQPMSEEYLLTGIPEITSISYAMAKLAGLYACLAYNRQYNKQIFIPVIPNSVYGPNDNFDYNSGHVLSSLISRFSEAKKNKTSSVVLWGSGSPKREFIFVDDLVDACIFIIKKNKINLPLNVGSGEQISIKNLAKKISNIIGYQGKVLWDNSKPDGTPRKLLDSKKINDLGWSRKVDLNDGLKLTIDWFNKKYD